MQFSDARAKIKRANKHIADLEHRLAEIPDSRRSSVEIDPNTRYKSLKHDIVDERWVTDVPLLIGDVVHNLKCALDYSWLEVVKVVVPSAVDKFAKFPVRETRDELQTAMEGRKIQEASPELFTLMLDNIRPYKGGDFAIWTLHDLDIMDKHRLLIPVTACVSIKDFKLEDEFGVHTASTWGAIQNPPYYITFPEHINIKEHGELLFEVSFDQAAVEDAPSVNATFGIYTQCIIEVVEALEAFVETI